MNEVAKKAQQAYDSIQAFQAANQYLRGIGIAIYPPNLPEPKLYVFVDASLSRSQQAVQASHGVAQYCQEHPNTSWRNQTIILKKVRELSRWKAEQVNGRDEYEDHSCFYEPDLKGQLTCVVGLGWEDLAKNFPLL
jgi:hypothetical protein